MPDLDLDAIKARNLDSMSADAPNNPDVWALVADRDALIDEVKRLRAAEQRVRALHPGQDEPDLIWCMQCSEPTPCTTRRAQDGGETHG